MKQSGLIHTAAAQRDVLGHLKSDISKQNAFNTEELLKLADPGSQLYILVFKPLYLQDCFWTSSHRSDLEIRKKHPWKNCRRALKVFKEGMEDVLHLCLGARLQVFKELEIIPKENTTTRKNRLLFANLWPDFIWHNTFVLFLLQDYLIKSWNYLTLTVSSINPLDAMHLALS